MDNCSGCGEEVEYFDPQNWPSAEVEAGLIVRETAYEFAGETGRILITELHHCSCQNNRAVVSYSLIGPHGSEIKGMASAEVKQATRTAR